MDASGKAKGKGKMRSMDDDEAHVQADTTPSFLNRVTASAKGLASSSMTANGSEANATLSTTLAASNKGSGSSAVPLGSLLNTALEVAANPPREHEADGFRMRQSNGNLTEDTEYNYLEQSNAPNLALETSDASRKSDTAFENIWSGSEPPTTTSKHTSAHDTFQTAWDTEADMSPPLTKPHMPQADGDGDEVVKMLANPSFQSEVWNDTGSMADDEEFTISAAEKAAADKFNEAISTSPSYAASFENELATIIERSLQPDEAAKSHEQALTFFDDIEHYHEDVWGVVATLIREAREELAQGREVSQSPAVARLQMILGHIDPSKLRSMQTSSKS